MHPVYQTASRPATQPTSVVSVVHSRDEDVALCGPLCNGGLRLTSTQLVSAHLTHEGRPTLPASFSDTNLTHCATPVVNNMNGSYLQSIHSAPNGMCYLPTGVTQLNPSHWYPHSHLCDSSASNRSKVPPHAILEHRHPSEMACDIRRLDRAQKQLNHIDRTVPSMSAMFSAFQPTHVTPPRTVAYTNASCALPLHSLVSHLLPLTMTDNLVSGPRPSAQTRLTTIQSDAIVSTSRTHASAFTSLGIRPPFGLTSSSLLDDYTTQPCALTSLPLSHSSVAPTTHPLHKTVSQPAVSLTTLSDSRPSLADACISPIPTLPVCTSRSNAISPLPESDHVSTTEAECNLVPSKLGLPPLPRLNMRHINVRRYPKYNTRKNSGFVRRLKHTGLILDARLTLRLLRKMVQPFVNRAVNGVLQHYMQEYIHIAVRNIRESLGEESVTEEDLIKFRRSIMRRVALQYFIHSPSHNKINSLVTQAPSQMVHHKPGSNTISVSKDGHGVHPVAHSMDLEHPPIQSDTAGRHLKNPSNTDICDNCNCTTSPQLSPASCPKPLIDRWPHPSCDLTLDSFSGESPRSPQVMRSFCRNPTSPQPHISVLCSHIELGSSDSVILSHQNCDPPCDLVNNTLGDSPSSVSSSSTLGFFRDSTCSDDSDAAHFDPPFFNGSSPSTNHSMRKDLLSTVNSQHDGSMRLSAALPSHLTVKLTRKRPATPSDMAACRSSKSTRSATSVLSACNTHNGVLTGSTGRLNDELTTSVDERHMLSTNRVLCSKPQNDSEYGHEALCDNDASFVETASLFGPHSSQSTSNSLPSLDLNPDTKFTLGSSANTWLGMGAARGRIYTKHPELFRYQCDTDDKAWLCHSGLLAGYGVKAYLMLADQVRYVGQHAPVSSHAAHSLQSFVVPVWLLRKIKDIAFAPRYSQTLSSANCARSSGRPTPDPLSDIRSTVSHTSRRCCVLSVTAVQHSEPERPSSSSASPRPPTRPQSRVTSLHLQVSDHSKVIISANSQTSEPLRSSNTSNLSPTHSSNISSPKSPRPPMLQRFDYC